MSSPKITSMRHPLLSDAEAIHNLMQESYAGVVPCSLEMVRAQITNYANGILMLDCGTTAIGYVAGLRIRSQRAREPHSWLEVSGHGCASSDDEHGDYLYGYELCVAPSWRRQGLGAQLREARKTLVRDLGLKGVFLAARLPGLSTALKTKQVATASEYVDYVLSGRLFDPVLSHYPRHGYEFVDILSNYNVFDTTSLGYAALMVWNA